MKTLIIVGIIICLTTGTLYFQIIDPYLKEKKEEKFKQHLFDIGYLKYAGEKLNPYTLEETGVGFGMPTNDDNYIQNVGMGQNAFYTEGEDNE